MDSVSGLIDLLPVASKMKPILRKSVGENGLVLATSLLYQRRSHMGLLVTTSKLELTV